MHRPFETVTPVQASSARSITPSSSRTLCENCQKNQSLIYQLMSDYIRDESVSVQDVASFLITDYVYQ